MKEVKSKHEKQEQPAVKEKRTYKFMVDEKRMSEVEKGLKQYKKSYTLQISGNVRSITDYRGHTWTGMNIRENSKCGYHLCKIVKDEVIKSIKEKGFTPYTTPYREQLFNLEAIKKNIGVPLLAVDIRNCYWRTAFLKGVICERTYIMGLRKNSWKIGRNASIGSLAKTTITTQYKDGVLIPGSKKITKAPIELQYKRNLVIGSVYEMFYRLYQEIGDGFVFFLTDCVYVPASYLKYVKKFFNDYSYQVKVKNIEIIQLDENRKILFWNQYDEKEGTKEKYYSYSQSQLLP